MGLRPEAHPCGSILSRNCGDRVRSRETADRGSLRIVNIEDREQLGDLQDLVKFLA
jgi:hypothetical protein